MSFITLESDVRRAWGALRFVDAMSRRTVEAPLVVELPGVRLRRNSRGLWVVMGLDAAAEAAVAVSDYENAFDRVPAQLTRTLTGRVTDAQGRFLSRCFALSLPRTPAATPFDPVDVVLDPSPALPLLSTWAALRLSVTRSGVPTAQAAIRVRRAGGAILGRGMTDARGEALVAVVGVAQVTPGAGDLVVEREIATEIVITVDTTLAPGALVDPDLIADAPEGAGIARLVVARAIASGRIETLSLNVP